jgi:hypothetical protein
MTHLLLLGPGGHVPTLPVLVAQVASAIPMEYAAPIALGVGVAAIISGAWKFRNWVRRQAHEVVGGALAGKPLEKRVSEINAAWVKSDDFKRELREAVAEAFTGRAEADAHFRRETLANQRQAITDAVEGLEKRLDVRFREVETKIDTRARETDARATELLVKVEFAVRDAKRYTAQVAGQYETLRKQIDEARLSAAAKTKERGA